MAQFKFPNKFLKDKDFSLFIRFVVTTKNNSSVRQAISLPYKKWFFHTSINAYFCSEFQENKAFILHLFEFRSQEKMERIFQFQIILTVRLQFIIWTSSYIIPFNCTVKIQRIIKESRTIFLRLSIKKGL